MDSTPTHDMASHQPEIRARRIGALMSGGALVIYGLSRRSLSGLGLAAAGGGIAYLGTRPPDAATTNGERQAIRVEQAITINRPVSEIYAQWRDFENLPKIMSHLISVTTDDGGRTHWEAEAPMQQRVSWNADIVDERENELIAWRSTNESAIANQGIVRFTQLPGDRGTMIHVTLEYTPPGGTAAAVFARLLGQEPTRQIYEDLHRFKQQIEAGEVATTRGQPSGPGGDISTVEGRWRFGRQIIDAARTLSARKPASETNQLIEERPQ